MTLLAGKYEIQRPMAVGGVAEIYLARTRSRTGAGRLVVVKRLLPALAREPELSRMLLAEATIVSVLEHPNITQVLDLGSVESEDPAGGRDYFIVMEFVHGRDLADVLARIGALNRRLPLAMVCEVLRALASGLEYAHAATDYQGRPLGLVHRDLSPHNVLVGFDGAVKISDFGIAKFSTDNVSTDAGVFKGKFRYMSPEQAARKEVDHRSDLFAVGIMLWEMLAGEPLFAAKSLVETVEKVRRAKVPDLRERRPELPARLWEVCAAALAKKPSSRLQSATELGEALAEVDTALPKPAARRTLGDLMGELYSVEERGLPEAGLVGAPREVGEGTPTEPTFSDRIQEPTETRAILSRVAERAKEEPAVSFADLVLGELEKSLGK